MQKPYIGRKIKYPNFVDIDKIYSNETLGFRYSLHIPFYGAKEEKELVVIMKNPSSASFNYCDNTISRVCNVAYNHGYSGVIILNLFPIRATCARQVVVFYASHTFAPLLYCGKIYQTITFPFGLCKVYVKLKKSQNACDFLKKIYSYINEKELGR